jgi:hypothetical protein
MPGCTFEGWVANSAFLSLFPKASGTKDAISSDHGRLFFQIYIRCIFYSCYVTHTGNYVCTRRYDLLCLLFSLVDGIVHRIH